MDNYLTKFSEQLDKEFKPETLFVPKKFYFMKWLKHGTNQPRPGEKDLPQGWVRNKPKEKFNAK